MANKEKIIKMLKKAIEDCEKHGAVSLVLSINHGEKSTNMIVGNLAYIAQALSAQSGDIENSSIPVIEKAIGIARIIY